MTLKQKDEQLGTYLQEIDDLKLKMQQLENKLKLSEDSFSEFWLKLETEKQNEVKLTEEKFKDTISKLE